MVGIYGTYICEYKPFHMYQQEPRCRMSLVLGKWDGISYFGASVRSLKFNLILCGM